MNGWKLCPACAGARVVVSVAVDDVAACPTCHGDGVVRYRPRRAPFAHGAVVAAL